MTAAPTVFLPLVGQFENIGDVMLRRQLAGWLADVPAVAHVYVGAAPDGFVAGLDLPAGAVVHRSFRSWVQAMGRASRGSSYVFKPGEIQTTVKGMREHLGLLPLIARLHHRAGAVVRVGAGLRQADRLFVSLMKPSARLADRVYWRDAETQQAFGIGEVMPDLAFAEGSDDATMAGADGRDQLVLSLRGDRPPPSERYLAAVTGAARRHGLRVAVATQVSFDRDRSVQLAERLGVDPPVWTPHADRFQEERLRELYRRSAVVVSDRLHVLIAAATEGAWPVGVVPAGHRKLARHLDEAGFTDVAAEHDPARPDQLTDAVGRGLSQRDTVAQRVRAARVRIHHVRDAVVDDLRSIDG